MLTSSQWLCQEGELQLTSFLYPASLYLSSVLIKVWQVPKREAHEEERVWIDDFEVPCFPSFAFRIMCCYDQNMTNKRKKNPGSDSRISLCFIPWEHYLISFHFCFSPNKHINENK